MPKYFEWYPKHDFDFPSKVFHFHWLFLMFLCGIWWHCRDDFRNWPNISLSITVLTNCTIKKCWFWLLKHARYVWSLRAVQVLKVNLSYYERNLSKKYQYLAWSGPFLISDFLTKYMIRMSEILTKHSLLRISDILIRKSEKYLIRYTISMSSIRIREYQIFWQVQ